MSSKFNICEYCKNLFPLTVIELHISTCPHKPADEEDQLNNDVESEIITIHNRRKLAKLEADRLKYSNFLQKIHSEEAYDAFYMTALQNVERERSWLSNHKNVTIVDELIKDPGNEMIVAKSFKHEKNNLEITLFENDPELEHLRKYFSIALIPLKELDTERKFKQLLGNKEVDVDLFSENELVKIGKNKLRADYLKEKSHIQRYFISLSSYQIETDEKFHHILEIYDRVQHSRIHAYVVTDVIIDKFDSLTIKIEDESINFPVDARVTNNRIESAL